MFWKSFWHNWQKQILEKFLKKPNHAYLFSWPEWIWKFSIAKDFAKLLLQDWQNDNEIFRKIDENIYTDCITVDKLWIENIEDDFEEIYKYSNFSQNHRKKSIVKTNTILIDDIHEIIELVNKSSIWKRKIIIIRDIERMNKASVNAFLKTLEEPPLSTFFICTTSNKQNLFPTMLSRLQEIKFNLFSDNEIKKYVHNNYWDKLSKIEIEDIVKFSFWEINSADFLSHNLWELHLINNRLKSINKIYESNSIAYKINHTNTIFENLWLINKEIELWQHYLQAKLYSSNTGEIKNTIKNIENVFKLKKDIKSNMNKKLSLDNFYFNLHLNS